MQSSLNVSLGGARKIEQRAHRSNSHAFRALCHSDDFVSGARLALFEHTEIEPRALVGHQQGRHPGLIHAYADTVAGHTRLGDFKQRPADAVAVADADLAVGQAFHSEVLSKLPEGEI